MPDRRHLLRALAAMTAVFGPGARVLGPSGAVAGESIGIHHPWARPTLPNRPGVAYLGIHNSGDLPDRLLGARTEAAGSVELHLARQDAGGVMTMAPVDAIEVPAQGMAHLGPGGHHLMLFDIVKPLKDGDSFDLILDFERAGPVTVTVPVSRKPLDPHAGGEGHMHHGGDSGESHGESHGEGHHHGHTPDIAPKNQPGN